MRRKRQQCCVGGLPGGIVVPSRWKIQNHPRSPTPTTRSPVAHVKFCPGPPFSQRRSFSKLPNIGFRFWQSTMCWFLSCTEPDRWAQGRVVGWWLSWIWWLGLGLAPGGGRTRLKGEEKGVIDQAAIGGKKSLLLTLRPISRPRRMARTILEHGLPSYRNG